MIQLNEMHNRTKKQSPLCYKIFRGVLIFLSGVAMFYYLLGVVNYVASGPGATLFDDLTVEFVIQVILLGLGLFYLIIAWFKHISYGIVAIVFTVLYAIYRSVLFGQLMVDFLPIVMAADAVGFIILGLMKKYHKSRGYNVYADPVIDEMQGPDIFNFKV